MKWERDNNWLGKLPRNVAAGAEAWKIVLDAGIIHVSYRDDIGRCTVRVLGRKYTMNTKDIDIAKRSALGRAETIMSEGLKIVRQMKKEAKEAA